jgi:hypothetical protein
VKEMLSSKIHTVPTLYEGPMRNDFDTFLPSLIKTSKFGKEKSEGVYIRVDDENYLIDRFKYRRNTFVPGRANFDSKAENNSLQK